MAERAEQPAPTDARASASAALDHLQSAALELIAAARSVLDAAEEVVHDPDALRQATGTLASIVDAAARIGRTAAGTAAGHRHDADGASAHDDPIERIEVD